MYFKPTSKISNVNTNIISFLNDLPFTERQTLDCLLLKANLFESVHPAQDTIAKEVGCTRLTINRNVSKLNEVNLVSKVTRLWNTCIYKINPVLNDPELRWQLRDKFKAFKVRPLLPLMFIPFVNIGISENRLSFHNHMIHHISLSYPSSFPNTYSYNNTSTTDVSTSTVEEVTGNVKNNKDELIVQKSNYIKTNSYSLKKDVVMLQKVKERLNLSEYETNQLSNFDDVVLLSALKAYEKTKGVSHPFRYFLGCCNRIKSNTKDKSQQSSTYKPIAWKNTEAPVSHRTAEFLRSEIQKIKAHSLTTIMTSEGSLFGDIKQKAINNLEVELSKLTPESTMSNDIHIEQPKTQQIKNNSTSKIVVDISKYRTSENSQQIDDWIKTIDYNPFEELEDFDLPLQL